MHGVVNVIKTSLIKLSGHSSEDKFCHQFLPFVVAYTVMWFNPIALNSLQQPGVPLIHSSSQTF